MSKQSLYNPQRHALIRAIVFITIGIIIIIYPKSFLRLIAYLIVGYLVFRGIYRLYQDYKYYQTAGAHGASLVSGILLLIVAAVFLYFARTLFSIFPFMLGLLIIIYSLINLAFVWTKRKMGYTIFFILLMIGGIAIVFNPFKTSIFLFQFFGIILTSIGISEFIGFIQSRKDPSA